MMETSQTIPLPIYYYYYYLQKSCSIYIAKHLQIAPVHGQSVLLFTVEDCIF